MLQPKYQSPDNPSEAFFEFPSTSRHATLCQSRLFERYKENWRTPRAVVSVALSSDNPPVSDNGVIRASHDGLVSNTFGFHSSFGTGHVLRTNGTICLFWNGEEVNIVELSNIEMLRVLLDGEKKEPKKKRILSAAMQKD